MKHPTQFTDDGEWCLLDASAVSHRYPRLWEHFGEHGIDEPPRRCAHDDETDSSGSPLGQGVAAANVLRLPAAGPGCDLSEELAVGIGPAALDRRVAPMCPPGPASVILVSLIMAR